MAEENHGSRMEGEYSIDELFRLAKDRERYAEVTVPTFSNEEAPS